MHHRRLLLCTLLALSSCGSSDRGKQQPGAAVGEPAGSAKNVEPKGTVVKGTALEDVDEAWVDRCLGRPSRISWEPDQLTADVAAATLAVDGRADPPTVTSQSYAPARQAEVDLTLVAAALATDHDAAALIDRAHASATAISEDSERKRALGWGAVELLEHGVDAARWTALLTDADDKHELGANQVRILAARGDLEGARRTLATLPPMWTIRSDVEYWHGYPRWLGSTAAAACAALASSAVVAAPGGRALVEDAEKLTAQITEGWRQNREQRAIALAWGRLGDLERGIVAASRMPGSERAGAIAELLDLYGDAPAVDLVRLDALARTAMAATKSAPLILADANTNRAALLDFVEDATLGEVAAAIVRRHLARKDVAGAKTVLAKIPTNLSAHHEAALQLSCARLRENQITLDEAIAALPTDDLYAANLARAAAQVGCMPVVQAVLSEARFGERIASDILHDMLAYHEVDAAMPLLAWAWDRMSAPDLSERQAELIDALAQGGRATEALALFRKQPAHQYPIIESTALAAGYRLVVALVAAKATDDAKALRGELDARRAKVERP
jgi:hypothetical protein